MVQLARVHEQENQKRKQDMYCDPRSIDGISIQAREEYRGSKKQTT